MLWERGLYIHPWGCIHFVQPNTRRDNINRLAGVRSGSSSSINSSSGSSSSSSTSTNTSILRACRIAPVVVALRIRTIT